MRIIFTQAYDENIAVQKWYPPLGLSYLAAYLKRHRKSDECLIEMDIERILELKPDIVGISSVTQNFSRAIEIARKIKKNINVPVIIGGTHISSLPDFLPDCFDLGVLGEGEKTLCELVGIYEKANSKFKKEDLSEVDGIVFKDAQGNIMVTAPRELILNLDELPFPQRELTSGSGKWLFNTSNMYMLTSRGCLYNCKFCSSARHWRKFRYASAEYVVNEIQNMHDDFAVTDISIFDDLFIANRKRLKEIVLGLEERGLLGNIRFACTVRADLFTDEIAGLLKQMNVSMLSFGAESASDSVLSYLHKGISAVTNQKIIDTCLRFDIKAGATFIIGTPVEKEIDLKKTYAFIKKNKRNLLYAHVYPLIAFPGTELYDYAVNQSLIDQENVHWDIFDLNPENFNIDKYIMLCPNYSKKIFHKYYKKLTDLNEEIENNKPGVICALKRKIKDALLTYKGDRHEKKHLL